jgi:DNA-binding SARP family transcriptional activator/WD40 repeat protein
MRPSARYQPGIGRVDAVSAPAHSQVVSVSLLGPLQVDGNGGLSPRDRVVLSALAVHSGEALSAEQLADALWGEQPPASWPKIVQGSVVRLRRTLGRDAVVTTTSGYRLALGDDEIDIRRFERLVDRGRSLAGTGEPDRAAAVYADALALWRGAALADLERWPDGRTEALRLDELRQTTEESLVAARMDAGQDVVADATALVAAAPVREHRWCLLARALYRAGRQTDALAALRRARRTLQEELGLDPGEELAGLERAILTHDPGLAGPLPTPRPASDLCPYKGLVVYDRSDSDWFFGRDEEVSACLRTLRSSPLLVVAGPSGSGKSSLVRAGVAPALEAAHRTVTVLTPGSDPAGSLTAALAGTRRDAVVVVDQLEELFTAGHDPSYVIAFLDRLVGLAAADVLVVAVVRADQLGALSASTALARMVERGLHLVAPMSEDELRQAVEGPAHRAGLRLEPGLVELLLRDVEGEAGALPLLSHALAETWARREGAVLTVDGYRSTGGIRGAVAQTAEQLWESLAPGQRTSVRSLLLRMVALSPEGEPAAARVPLVVAAPDPERERLVALLARCRLVTTDDRSVTVAHEAVMRAWPRLRSWLDEDAAGQRILRHLSVAAEDWEGRGRPDSELYRGARLAATTEWRARATSELTTVEADFLDASEALARAEQSAERERAQAQARQNRRLRVALTGTALGLVLALLAGIVAVQQSRDQARTARAALVGELVAQSVAHRSTQRDLATLLALEAHRMQPGASTRGALFGALTAAPGFLGLRSTGRPGGTGTPLTSGRVLSDGRTLLAAGVDGVVREIDLWEGYAGVRFPAPALETVSALVDVSRDERTVAVASWEGGGKAVLSVYERGTRSRVVPDTPLPLDVGAVAVGPRGRFVAVSGYDDGRVLVYDLTVGPELPSLPSVHDRAPGVRQLTPISPSESLDAVEEYVRSKPGTPLSLSEEPAVRYTAGLAFRGDGALVAGSEVGIVRVVDPATGRELRRFEGAPPLTSNKNVSLSPDDSVLVTTGTKGVVRWDTRTGKPMWTAAVGESRCWSVLVVPALDSVLCGGEHSQVVTLDLATGRETGVRRDMQQGQVSGLLLTADGRTLVQLSDTHGRYALWRLDGTGPVTRLLGVRGTPTGYSPDGRLLTMARDTRGGWPVTTVVDARTGTVVNSLDGYAAVSWTGRGHHLTAWSTKDYQGYVLEAATGRRIARLDGGLGEIPEGTSTSADARMVLAWGRPLGHEVRTWIVWDLRSGEPVAADTFGSGVAGSLSADGRLMAWASRDGVSTFTVDGPRRLTTDDSLVNGAVSPTGLVAAATWDGRLGFYDARTLEPSGRGLPGTPGQMEQFAFSREGDRLVVRGGDGAVRVVDVAARLQLGEPILTDLEAGLRVALRDDGRELAVAGSRGLLVWDLRPGRWAEALCQMAGRNLTRQEWRLHLSGAGDYRRTCPRL